MIPLHLPALAEAEQPFVTRLRSGPPDERDGATSYLLDEHATGSTFAGPHGLLAVDRMAGADLDGDIVLVQPAAGRLERLLRAGSRHNTLLVTERCDQLCVMCSQPPKKTHVDRFALFEEACLMAEPGSLIGISGGEPTLYKDQLLDMIGNVLSQRPDLQFHVLTNGQHFERGDVERLRDPIYRRVSWGIPLYAPDADLHDETVGKAGAYARLQESLALLLLSGARVELRTVVLTTNLAVLPSLARYVATRLRFIEMWSIMQLENIGFARNRWNRLFVDHRTGFEFVAAALDHAALHAVRAQLFNFPRCCVPTAYRHLAVASISDWKRKYVGACDPCRERERCCGFFEWHPDSEANAGARPL
jgi:His-Xaa-Ser system radical SAM maturase HxsC